MTGRSGAEGWALFLDFDGTLVEIAETPDAVRVDPALPDMLRKLRERLGGALAIVTGRTIADLERHLPGLDASGLHGLEQRIAGAQRPASDLPRLDGEIAALRRRFADRPGIVIEDKGVGLTVHWRMAPEAAEEARRAIDEIAARLGPAYRVQDGKAVREILPARAGKGEGIRALLGEEPYRGRTPLFVGDDKTDEHGFQTVKALGGVGVKVGDGETAASFRLPSPHAVRAWLERWTTGSDPMDGLRGAA